MIGTKLRDAWAAGEITTNGWLIIGNTLATEIMASQGYDSLTIDLQHGVMSEADLLPMLQTIRASGAVPLVRPGWLDAAIIMRALDFGAAGIVCPMISTRAEAEALVSYVRYPPHGTRSYGPVRASLVHGADYYFRANDEVLCFAMIETAEGIENLEEIVATPGLDGIYVGPNDLAIGVSNGELPPATDREEPHMQNLLKKIAATAHEHGRIACLHCASADGAARGVTWGYNLVTVVTDVALLGAGKGQLDAARAAIDKAR